MEGLKRLEQEVMEMNNFNVYTIFNQIKDLPELQDKFDNKEKTIKGMYEYVYEKARTVKQGNVAMVNDKVVYLWAITYFSKSNEELGLKEKKVMPYRNYICPWKEGDVYAYQLKEEGENKGKYIAFIKVGNYSYPPHNVCPLVYVYNKIFDQIPKVEELKNIKYLPQVYAPISIFKEGAVYKCLIGIQNSTKKYIINYIYIGNLKNYLLPQNERHHIYELNNQSLCLIKKFEEEQLKNYENWKDIDY